MSASEYKSKGMGRKILLLNALIILAITAVVLFVGVCAAGSSLVSRKSFPDNTVLDGVDVSGMSPEAGRAALENHFSNKLDETIYKLNYDNKIIELSAAELGISYDLETAIAKIFYENGGSVLAKYLDAVMEPREPGDIAVLPILDRTKIESALENALSPFYVEAENAKMVFNEAGDLSFLPETAGHRAKTRLATDLIIQSFGAEGAEALVVSKEELSPKINQAKLEENTELIGECIIPLPVSENAVSNLSVACNHIDGIAIESGEIFSLCGNLGAPTEKNGYLPALEVCEGEPHEELSGGICRLSGALYNAALLTNMEIVSRFAHSYVPDYFPPGLDAVIDWVTKDLKLKNVSDYPIYISARIADGNLALRLYGEPLFEGLTIKVATDRVREIEPSEPDGTIGYEVAVFRNYYVGTELKKSEQVSRDIYEAKAEPVISEKVSK